MEALNVSFSVQNLIMQKLDQEIAEKELVKKKLTPFLLQDVFGSKISPNIHSMTQHEPRNKSKCFFNKQIDAQPTALPKDNMDPKNVRIGPSSPSQSKSTTKKLRRFTVSSKKQQITDMNTSKQFCKINQDAKLLNNQIQFNNIKFNHTIQLSSSPKLSRRISKTKNEPIRLHLKKASFHEVDSEQQNKLRAKKMQEEQVKIKNLQLQILKSQRFEKLKERFKIHEIQNETISFDFDGSVINLEEDDNENLSILKERNIISQEKDSQRQQISKKFQTIQSKNHQDSQKEENLFLQKHSNKQHIGMPFHAIYNIKNKVLNSLPYDEEIGEAQKFNGIQKNYSKINNSSLQQRENNSEFLLNSTNNSGSKKSKYNGQASNQISLESSKNFESKNNHGAIKIFNVSSIGQKNPRNQKQSQKLQVQKEKQYTNNFQRQISTIPYLQISEGIRYQEEIAIFDDQNINFKTKKFRYATIQKPRNLSQKSVSHHSSSLQGNLTFRSYFPLNLKEDGKLLSGLNKTISVFSDSGKSFRFGFSKDHKRSDELKKLNRNRTAQEKDQFAIFDPSNPIFIRDRTGSKTNSSTCRPQTTQTGIRVNQNWQQNSRPFFDQKTNKNTNILDMKQKMLLKQKQRVMSSQTARTIK